jgi:dTDP-4-dehydrorhamnose reductase
MIRSPKKILVIGAGGMLGHMAVRVLGETFEVFGTTRSESQSSSLLGRFLDPERWMTGIDVLNERHLENVFEQVKPDVVINCVGLVKQKMDSTSYIESLEINALLPHKLFVLGEKYHAKIIQLSTDCVFTCDDGIKRQTDIPNATDLYGRTKHLGELNYGTALTLRTSIVGRQLSGQESFFEWIISQQGKVSSGYRNALYTGLTTHALSNVMCKIIANNFSLSGIWQIASEPISKFELMTKLNRSLNLEIDIQEDTEFHCDRRLDGTQFLETTGIRVPTWDEMIQQFSDDQVSYKVN